MLPAHEDNGDVQSSKREDWPANGQAVNSGPSGSTKMSRRLSEEEIEEIEAAGEVSPAESSHFNQVCLITALSFVGVYLRIVLVDATPPGFVNYLTAQFIGSFVLGLLFAIKGAMHIDIFTAISVGFCGTLTTFSSWQLDIVQIIVGVPGAPSTGSGKAYAWFQDQTIGFAVPFCGLAFGKHVAAFLALGSAVDTFTKKMLKAKYSTPTLVSRGSLLCMCLALIGVIAGAIEVPGATTFSLIFAPVGALTRFALSIYLNPKDLRFFWGTFSANIIGSVIIAVIFGVRTRAVVSELSCAALVAVQNGFCGALTTVSTFVNEIHTLPFIQHAYIYGISSVITAQICMIIIMGSFVWSERDDAFANSNICFFATEI